jgi:hypothetical protein
VRRGDRAHVGQRQRRRRKAATGVDHAIECGAWAEGEVATESGRPSDEPRGHARQCGKAAHQVDCLCPGDLERGADHRHQARLIAAAPACRLDRARRRRQVEQCVCQCHAGGAVERRMVDLGVEPQPAILQAFDYVKAPERARAIERLCMQAGDGGFELGQRARRRQRDAHDVAFQVDLFGADPDRIGEIQRHLRELACEHRRQVHPPRHVSSHAQQVIAPPPGSLQQVHGTDVHRRGRCFQMQEQ